MMIYFLSLICEYRLIFNRVLEYTNSLATFSFDLVGAKEKVTKKKTPIGGISRSAEREEAFAASTAQTFEKV
ncbi:MAG: hypothetical protein IJX19_08370 [Clostridia bacterium]|nr:hypothetical protein [Clostridia bacterium]